MIAAVSCLLLALACQDAERISAPIRVPEAAQAGARPTLMLALTCTLSRSASTVSCAPATSRAPGVSASVILSATGTYAQFVPFNLVKDTVHQVWSFDAFLHNLMQQSIGTLNGTTVTGSKVFVTDIEATQGTGTVSIINADGTGNFTAPNQKYFNYNQIVSPAANSNAKLWKVSVPNTVTAVNMDILMSTDFPAELNVTATPPDSQPEWFSDDSSWSGPTHQGVLKGVVSLCFQDSATVQDRQLAVAFAGGTIIGGEPVDGGDGCYYMKVPSGGLDPVDTAVNRLMSLPQVDVAAPTAQASPAYLRPHDGNGWTAWGLSPDSIGPELDWALEAIDAPYAWGCSTGDTATHVSVIDHAFNNAELSANVTSGASSLGAFPSDPLEHGTMTSAIVAARGNDSIGITGVMWRAGLRLVELKNYHPSFESIGRLIAQQANAGSKIVNLSYWSDFQGANNRAPQSKADSDAIFRAFHFMMVQIRRARGTLPLIVVSAGDNTIDAFWSVFPILHDSLANRTLVVAGSTRQRQHLTTAGGFASGSGDGRLVDLYAPGGAVGTEQLRNGQLVQVAFDGTSFSAPLVAGAAGLILSFDPRLSPDSLRTLLLNGATLGNRSITDPAGQVHYLVDVYATLKLAAQRPGAPLCGNKVWVTGAATNDSIVVQRSTGPETIWSDADFIADMDVKHGGHRISYTSDFGDQELGYNATSRKWAVSTNPNVPPPGADGGAFASLFGLSHDEDSSLAVTFTDIATSVDTIGLTDSHTNTTSTLTVLPTSLVKSLTQTCVRQNFDPTTGDTTCLQTSGIGEEQIANTLGAYSPRGDSAIISISRTEFDFTMPNSAWGSCDGNPFPPPPQVQTQCRFIQTTQSALDTRFFSLPIHQFTTNATPFWTLTGIRATNLAISEDGKQLVVGGGSVASSSQLDQPQYLNCGVYYRNLVTGVTDPVISSAAACIWRQATSFSTGHFRGPVMQLHRHAP